MSSEWRLQKISELGSFERGKSKHRPRDAAHLYGGPYPFIQTGDITNSTGRITKYRQTYSVAGLEQSRMWPANTLAITIAANIAETALLTFPACFPDSVVGFTADSKKSDVRFIEYLFQAMRKQVKSKAYGSVQENINLEVLRGLEFPIPNLDVQVKIADFLSTIDDCINTLRETNVTLKAMTQAIFKSWFIDFDPVHAKLEGRVPEGMDEATAELFPDSFEESELGLIPKGWSSILVSEVTEITKGKSYASSDLVEKSDTALVTLKSFARGGGFRLDGFKPYAGTYKESQVVVAGDLVVAYTDVTQAAELIGKPAIVISVEKHKTLVASLDLGIIRPITRKVSTQFLYGLFNTDAFQAHTFSHTSGTTVLHLSKDGVGSYRFVYPSFPLITAFSVMAESLASQQQANLDELHSLQNLRDTLLPRLVAGQLRIPESPELALN